MDEEDGKHKVAKKFRLTSFFVDLSRLTSRKGGHRSATYCTDGEGLVLPLVLRSRRGGLGDLRSLDHRRAKKGRGCNRGGNVSAQRSKELSRPSAGSGKGGTGLV